MDKMTIYIGREPMTFIWCPPGTFTIGNRITPKNGPTNIRRVEFTEGFWLLETPVTKAMYYALKKDAYMGNGAVPYTGLSYWDVLKFCDKLKEFDGREFCLPTEAQWEYACAAGTRSSIGGAKCVTDVAWYSHNTYSIMPVALRAPNRWGFYDMLGNVIEMCYDDFSIDINAERSEKVHKDFCIKFPPEHVTSQVFVGKGGNYCLNAIACQVSRRWGIHKDSANSDVGFRLIMR